MGAYPITPASDILHELSKHKSFGIHTIQAEDEIAAACAAIGASYAGNIGVTATSGPGIALKGEAIGLAVATELPLIIVNIQRGGPSTGLPTKTEQADLLQAMYGRNGEAPVAVIAAQSPGDCFYIAIEAVRLATKYMVPVMVLTDGYLAIGTEPWKIPSPVELPHLEIKFRTDPVGFHPFLRDPETLGRPWAIPGTPGLRHRIGGIEMDYDSGHISYDPENHQKMSEARRDKIVGMQKDIPEQRTEEGPEKGRLLVLGWGSTYGAIRESVRKVRASGGDVSHAHVRYLNPFPANLGQLLDGFEKILIPELNLGQLSMMIRSQYLRNVSSYTKIQGQPFRTSEMEARIREELEN
jgi:2-oxoglutarate ferredoxin oxidoreductase subunit alpha